MDFVLFINNSCPGCVRVLNFVHSANFSCRIEDIEEKDHDIPADPLIVPALVSGNKLLAYGDEDIINLLRSQASGKPSSGGK